MGLFQKIKKHGIRMSCKYACMKIAEKINILLFYAFRVCPINKKRIVLESEGDLSDNAYALYAFMSSEGYLKKYQIVWMVQNVKTAKKHVSDVELIPKSGSKINLRRAYYLATCGWHIYDHSNMMANVKKRDAQTLIYLSHGWGYKMAKGASLKNDKSQCKYITATGKLSAEGLAYYWQIPVEKVLITGYPRIDYFYKKNQDVREFIEKKWHFSKYKKVLFWMPTFRKSINASLSEDYMETETGLPIFTTKKSLEEFADFLKQKQILLIFKMHHLQAELPTFKQMQDPILVVRDEELYDNNIQLYQFLACSDALISDYSSVLIDYMALDRPLIYTLDDYEEYNKSRGLYPENAISYMPGYHVYNRLELEEAICEICDGIDKYAQQRNAIKQEYHTYADGNSARRVLEKTGVLKTK